VRVRGNDKRAALEAAADEHIRVSEEDGDTVLTVRGMSKHASNPDGSLNAMLLAAKALAACGIDQAVMDVAATVLADYEGAFCGIKEGDNAEMRLTFANGIVRTNDGRLELTFDMRFVADKGIEVHAEKLNAWFAAHGWEFIVKEGEPGYRIPESDPKLSIVLDEYNRMTGENAKLFYMSGGTYGRMLEGRAMPSGLSLYGSWATLPAGHGGGHQPDEYIPCDGFLNAIEFHARVLARLSDV
jgi:succinyl-diaminopimelate desuccinylase